MSKCTSVISYSLQPSRNALAPQLLVISAKGFNEEPTEMSRDMLPMKGYQIYNCNDYHLGVYNTPIVQSMLFFNGGRHIENFL